MINGRHARPARASLDLVRLALDIDPEHGTGRPMDQLRASVTAVYNELGSADRRKLIALLACHARAFAMAVPVAQRDHLLAALDELSLLEG